MARQKSAATLKFDRLREKFPVFRYVDYSIEVRPDSLFVEYCFDLAGAYTFRPSFSIPHKTFYGKKFPTHVEENPVFRNLIFNIGLIELVSYWKTACSPTVIIEPHSLSESQVRFWKKVYYNGLGEFFYTNSINISEQEFMNLESQGVVLPVGNAQLDDKVLVPVGGGKDSVVTLELLRNEVTVKPLIMNPRGATLETARVAGYGRQDIAEITRRLDPLLLRLNEEGFLNGHTPFSALLGFYTLLIAQLSGFRHIALSNESSANEPTIPGTHINHQYSKTYEFESDFRNYVSAFIAPEFNYFSFLRPLNELQIARLFSENVRYFPVFKSCNAGSKTDSWCCNCSKCLFAWTILSPFIPLNELVHIFGKNLYEEPGMIPYLKELSGIADQKPFECVGTLDDVNAALALFIHQNKKHRLPLLADYYSNSTSFSDWSQAKALSVLSDINSNHFLDQRFLEILTKRLIWKND